MRLVTAVPLWLIGRLTPPCHREALLGDLSEELAAGRGFVWLWREAFAAALALRWSWRRYAIATLKATVVALGLSVMAAGTLSWAQTLERGCGEVEQCPR